MYLKDILFGQEIEVYTPEFDEALEEFMKREESIKETTNVFEEDGI